MSKYIMRQTELDRHRQQAIRHEPNERVDPRRVLERRDFNLIHEDPQGIANCSPTVINRQVDEKVYQSLGAVYDCNIKLLEP